jgi:mono/diheme cytochrome c family protein
MRNFKNTMIISGLMFVLFAFTTVQLQSEKWVVPEKYEKMKNPTEVDDEENMEIGMELYMKHCKSCHGKEGLGDGPKAEEQEGDLGDFSSEEFQAQSDGAIFYKTTFGRDDMPAYDKKMPEDEDRWLVVNYVRSLGE